MNGRRRLVGSLFRSRQGDPQRWVVVDVESSGLDPHRDRLLAIAGVAISFSQGRPRVELADSFEVTLRQDESGAGQGAGQEAGTVGTIATLGAVETAVTEGGMDRPNILLHGIGVGAQRGGVPPLEAMEEFRQWAGPAPLVGYHAAFDRTMIQRYCLAHLRRRLDNPWLDLEPVVALLVPDLPDRTLDSAMSRLGIACPRRHQAAADTLATADVLLRLWPLATAEMNGRSDFRSMARLSARHRWLRGQRG